MKSTLFFLLIFAMLGATCYIGIQKYGDETGLNPVNKNILPAIDWEKTLVGKWRFQTRLSSPKELWIFKGVIEYSSDGKFTRHVNIKYYQDGNGYTPNEDEYDLGIVAGGRVSGLWEVDTSGGVWLEMPTSCNVINSIVKPGFNEKYNSCNWFQKDVPYSYGFITETYNRTGFQIFNKNKIVIEGESFDDDGKQQWIFERER